MFLFVRKRRGRDILLNFQNRGQFISYSLVGVCLMEADKELVCRGLHSVINQIFSVETVMIFKRAVSLHVYI